MSKQLSKYFTAFNYFDNTLIVSSVKMEEHNKIVMLAKSKLNNIETLICQTLIDRKISDKEF